MCGRYHVSTEEDNIEMLYYLREALGATPSLPPISGDIVPSLPAPVITENHVVPMLFGMQLHKRQKLVINARSETVTQSPMFSPLMHANRCLIPATAFYEWSPTKEKHIITPAKGKLFHFAGLFQSTSPLGRFVILTCQADQMLDAIHHRMPFILPSEEYQQAWLHSPSLAEELLHLLPPVSLSVQRISA